MSVQSTLNPRRNSAMRERAAQATERGSWLVTIGLILLTLAAMAIVAPIVSGLSWFLPSAIAMILTYVAVQTVRQLTGRMWLAALTGLLALIASIILLAGPTSPFDLFTAPIDRFAEFAEQAMSDTPPIRESPAVTLLVGTITVAIAMLADIIAQTVRAPAFAPIAMLPFVVVPVTVGVAPAPWYFWALLLLAVVLFLYLGHRWLQQGDDEARAAFGFTADGRGTGGIVGALLGGVAAIAVAALIAVLLPPTSGAWWGIFNGTASLSTNRVNPIIDLGDDLRRSDPVDLLRYATSQSSGDLPYVSLTTLTQLSEETEWVPNDFTSTTEVSQGEQPGNENLEPGANVLEVNNNIVLEPGVTAYLPHIGTPNEITNLNGTYLRDDETGDMREEDEEARAQSYQANSSVPMPRPEQRHERARGVHRAAKRQRGARRNSRAARRGRRPRGEPVRAGAAAAGVVHGRRLRLLRTRPGRERLRRHEPRRHRAVPAGTQRLLRALLERDGGHGPDARDSDAHPGRLHARHRRERERDRPVGVCRDDRRPARLGRVLGARLRLGAV
jgi:hypothetical protein